MDEGHWDNPQPEDASDSEGAGDVMGIMAHDDLIVAADSARAAAANWRGRPDGAARATAKDGPGASF